jgi:WhiB family redox-sensing transcriptional regulator
MEWLRSAACAGEDPELFFPVGTAGPALRDVAAAKQVCDRCVVARECLSYALDLGPTAGVWGGTREEERADLLRVPRTRHDTSHDISRTRHDGGRRSPR